VTGSAIKADDISALDGIVDVSRETSERLARFVALLRKWQAAQNLVSPKTLPTIWRRHVADSAQLVSVCPDARTWLDLGSGAGFPSLVVAILLGPTGQVDLIESDGKKCAFLREAIRVTGAPAKVHQDRIESVVGAWPRPVDVVTARGLAPLAELLAMVEPLVAKGARALFHKGGEFEVDLRAATTSWDFDLVKHKSKVDDAGVILEITRVARKT
jgi:16S rRNA (guanine527-N7)-methyltransferase